MLTDAERMILEKELQKEAEDLYRPFPKELFDKYRVKRGLRNEDGTGVMTGLTSVGQVIGYYIDDNEKLPAEGQLRYRGYNILDIVKNCENENRFGFEEVAYLLLFGHLPDRDTLRIFQTVIGSLRKLPDGFAEDIIFKAPSANIMNKIGRSVLALYSYDMSPDDVNVGNILRQSIELIARLPVIAAYGYQAKSHYHDGKSLYLHAPQDDLSTAENFLFMMRPDNKYTPEEASMLDLMLMIHAEHGGGNNSAFTTRVVSSTGTDTYSAISAAIGSLKGPKHGGANERVMAMMNDIESGVSDWKDEEEISAYLEKILGREAFDGKGLIYGMGHAVYTLSDPRCILLKEKAEKLVSEMPEFRDEFELYKKIEKLTPPAFRKVKGMNKVMCANVDMYSGFVYKMLGIPAEMYTPLFALARITGWCAHRLEETIGNDRIIRPAYKAIVHRKDYIPIDKR